MDRILKLFLLVSLALPVLSTRTDRKLSSFEEYEALVEENDKSTTPEQIGGRSLSETMPPSSTVWPQFVPSGPFFFDTECFGRFNDFCSRAGRFCRWYTVSDPTCYDTRFVSVTIPPAQVENKAQIPLHVKFFQFNFGVHLVEGTFIKRFYSVTVDECAKLCLKSAGGLGTIRDKLRCMSFDFYPFETWIAEPPFNEAQNKGVCVLNNETKDTARMRNEDQGLTDAEIYYKSHCTYRPFSSLDGYYEVRDPRGALTALLEYAGPTSLGLEAPWGGSRWGMFHPNLPGYMPVPLTQDLDCRISSGDVPPPPSFRGGFTPINDEQRCPGLMTKEEARSLCISRGGDLCRNQTDLNNISGRKLGCSFDQSGEGLIWHDAIRDVGQKRYPRCCSTYFLPLNNIVGGRGVCEPYEKSNVDFCGQFKNTVDCLYSHNPFNRESRFRQSWLNGFGHGMDDIREECRRRKQVNPSFDCAGMDLGPWETKTNCIWCPQAGLLPIGGNGQCRPGGSYGICPTASEQQKQIFALRIRSACADNTNCGLIRAFPDLLPYMGNVTTDSGLEPGEETKSPTMFPTTKTKSPTIFPTKRASPTTKSPTVKTSAPTLATSAPSQSPTMRTKSPTNALPTKRPTGGPPTSVTSAPSLARTSSPSQTTKAPTKGPTAGAPSATTSAPTLTTATPTLATKAPSNALPTKRPTKAPTPSARVTSAPTSAWPDFDGEEE